MASASRPLTRTEEVGHPLGERRLRLGAALLLLSFALSLGFAPLGASDPDDGLSLAFARRIVHGQRPYVDFIYSKPPLSPYLHAAAVGWLPPAQQVLGARVAFYALVALYSILAAALLCREFGARRLGIDTALLAAAGFVFSVHDFPPMLWHTVDGIALATLGVAALARGPAARWIVLGALGLVASALTKQSFYPMLLLAPILAGSLYGRRVAALAAATVALGVAAAAAALFAQGAAAAMWRETWAVAGVGGLVQSGVVAYLGCSIAQILPAIAVGGVARELARRRGRDFDWGIAVCVGFGLLFAGIIAVIFAHRLAPLLGIASSYNPQTLLVLSVGVAALELRVNRRAAVVFLALLAVSWSSGITYGGQGPGLAAAPLLFGVMLLATRWLGTRLGRPLQLQLVVGGIAVFTVAHLVGQPARPLGSLESLGSTSPDLALLWDSPASAAKVETAARELARYGPRTAILPGMPLLQLAVETPFPLPVDLVAPVDTAGERKWVERELDAQVDTVLLELDELRESGRYDSPIVEEVRREWPLIERLPDFEVRRNPHAAR